MASSANPSLIPCTAVLVRRDDFPRDFKFGCATSAIQTEGAGDEGGRGPSTWDSFIQSGQGHRDIAVDSYHRYKEDVQLLKNMGVDTYRFSISWSRLLPDGTIGGGINRAGINFYNNLIDELLKYGITPFVTLFHFDLPQKLQDSYDGFFSRQIEDVQLLKNMGVDTYRFSISWSRLLPDGTISGGINRAGINFYNNLIDELLKYGITPFVTLFHFDLPQKLQDSYDGFFSRQIVNDFKAYANLCFQTFGDRVKYWTTINEPQIYGYKVERKNSTNANPATDTFLATHNMILCHAHAAQLYKQQYQATQNGKIGIPIVTKWFKPLTESREDVEAAGRAFDFLVGWVLEPLVYGDYPFTMKSLIRNGLPTFRDEEKALVQNSFDFIGCNYYTSRYASSIPFNPNETPTNPDQFQSVNLTVYNLLKQPIGEKASGSDDVYLFPEGLKDILVYIKKHYKDPTLYVTENGYPEKRDDSIPLEVALQDDSRIRQILTHLTAVKQAINEGANVKGYLMWALMDSMEFESGYQIRYGLNYTDYLNLNRIPKKSAKWFHSWLNEHGQTQITNESSDAPNKAGRILSSLTTCFKTCTT